MCVKRKDKCPQMWKMCTMKHFIKNWNTKLKSDVFKQNNAFINSLSKDCLKLAKNCSKLAIFWLKLAKNWPKVVQNWPSRFWPKKWPFFCLNWPKIDPKMLKIGLHFFASMFLALKMAISLNKLAQNWPFCGPIYSKLAQKWSKVVQNLPEKISFFKE